MILDRFLLTDRVAIVTGGGRGIGAAIATAFADAGADLVLAARTPEQLDAVAEEVRQRGRRAIAFPCDLDDLDTITELVATTVGEFGRLDIVVNNAGGSPPRAFSDTSTRMLEKAFHFNVTTAFALTREAAPHLTKGDSSSVVNISSAVGRMRDKGVVAYGTAKAALSHLTRLTAADLAPAVRVNGIAVGSVATSALDYILVDDGMRSRLEDVTLVGRLGQPEDIAAAALWLASPAAGWVTGKIVEVDGGMEIPPGGLPSL